MPAEVMSAKGEASATAVSVVAAIEPSSVNVTAEAPLATVGSVSTESNIFAAESCSVYTTLPVTATTPKPATPWAAVIGELMTTSPAPTTESGSSWVRFVGVKDRVCPEASWKVVPSSTNGIVIAAT